MLCGKERGSGEMPPGVQAPDDRAPTRSQSMRSNEPPAQETAGTTTDSDTTAPSDTGKNTPSSDADSSTDPDSTDPDSTDPDSKRPQARVRAAPAQVLAGVTLASAGKTACSDCGGTIREGDAVGVYATRVGGDVRFEPARVHCYDCRQRRLPHWTPGASQLVAFGRVAVTADDATRDARLTVRDPAIVAQASAE